MKKLQLGGGHHPPTFKFDLKMKLTSLLLIAMVFCMNANDSYAQRTRITLDVNNITIAQVLDEIENSTEFKFIYSIKNVDLERKVSIKVEQLRIHNILRSLFDQTRTSYKIRGRQVILTKVEPIPAQENKAAEEEEIPQRTLRVEGKILDNLGVPLPGVSIIEKGTTNGVASDFDGNFQLNVEEGAILVFTSIGFLGKELPAQASMSVTLKESTSELDEVVVVAQGIAKSRKALGYALSKVDTDETDARPEADVARTLQGKISGVRIFPTDGSSGATANIRVRGNLSLSESNAVLIVVDNVVFSGNLIDIDPNSIADITILKGLNASVLYGSQGRNGVILIETKAGSAKVGEKSFTANITQTSYTNTVANLPDFQNTFGAGNNGVTDASTIGNLGSNGARFTDLDFVPHPLANDSRFPEFSGIEVPFEAAPNNVRDFFNTGIGSVTSLNLTATGEKTSLNFSLGYTDEGGILGNNDFNRFNISVGGTSQLTDKLKLSSSLSFSSRKRNSYTAIDTDDDDGSDILSNLYIIPRSLDIQNLPFQDPADGSNVYYRTDRENPRWTINNTGREDIIRRVNGTVNLNYQLGKHHSLTYRGGLQVETNNRLDFRNRGGLGDEASLGSLNLRANAEFDVDNTLIFGSNYQISDKLSFESQLGINSRYETFRSLDSEYTNQIVYGFLRPNNFRTPGEGDYDETKNNLLGVFGQFDFDYNRYLYLNLSGRLDKGSTVEKENQNLFYPGVSLSFIPTSAFDFGDSFINYLKIRGAYATSSGFPSIFNTRQSLSSDPREFSDINGNLIVTNSLFGRFANPDLEPELHKEFELGLEGNFFNNAVTFQASVFSRISENQIFETGIAPATGFTSTVINAGRVDTEGLELDLGIKLFRGSDFNWDIRNTFTTFKSTVVDLPGDITRRIDPDDNIFLIEGEELGIFTGSYVVRDSEGNALVNPATGVLITSDDVGLQDEIIGNVQPDFRATTIHTLRYKNFTLSTQMEYAHGGDEESSLFEILLERGVTTDTENREGSFVIPGVFGDISTGQALLDVNGNTIPNNIQVSGNNAVFSNFYEADENNTFDASVFRIREVALSYNLNRKTFKNLPFSSVDFTLSGRNVFFRAPNFPAGVNYDPETSGLSTPTTKRYALTVSVNF
ncbi:SusC/RagA family TonB-linked outer membrane protein [Flagellimonas sp. HMM57]|uniref:SusC/RagA family TonB-linked outer membrane protein n=1 Tax=unclassified Flagellimonas TaxID=2644544 RepID=UPI0013CF4DE3|nr:MULTISPECIES: SusC/RagA family TonB-linked outer membrane protein [unclassified Flagellimonas]UII76191.1 SusC/RagA family TonB-linked outer membrane protein [Flagellimonas sp. HMM57]